jgi:hypothetical protein
MAAHITGSRLPITCLDYRKPLKAGPESYCNPTIAYALYRKAIAKPLIGWRTPD